MHLSFFALAGVLMLAFLAGFASHRGSLCAVKAVEEVMKRRRARVAASFIRAGLWAFLTATLLDAVAPSSMTSLARYDFAWATALGAASFGIGAAINRGCALSTLSRLSTGEFSKLLTVLGFVLGAATAAYGFEHGFWPTAAAMKTSRPALGSGEAAFLALLAATLVYDLICSSRKLFRRSGWRGLVLARHHPPILGAALLGVSGGALSWAVGPWTYTVLTRELGYDLAGFPAAGFDNRLLGAIVLLVVAGSVTSSLWRGGWRLSFGDWRGWSASFFGGAAMGFGLATTPGGNDELLLVSIGAGSPHAIPSYALIFASIAFVLWIRKRGT